jgi:hypothetical protein
MNDQNTRPARSDFNPYAYSASTGTDEGIENGSGNVNRIVIDFGKHASSTIVSAIICGICLAVTVGTVWHSKDREVETNARIQVLKNHADDAFNSSERLREEVKELRSKYESRR